MDKSPISPPLPDSVLKLRSLLSQKPAPVTLTGNRVTLRPANPDRDAEPLFELTNGRPITLGDRSIGDYDADALVWRYMSRGPFASVSEMHGYLTSLANEPRSLCLAVDDNKAQHVVGVACYINNFPEHLKIELGSIWYSPIAQRTGMNTEATYLMLGHAFDLGYRRVEWKCDAQNERSRHSALRMGFQFEGIQRNHMIIKGHNRDTAWFCILDDEWVSVEQRLDHEMSQMT